MFRRLIVSIRAHANKSSALSLFYYSLDYAIQNRNEWKERGRELVAQMLREVSSPMDGKALDSLDEGKVEAPCPPIPSVIGGQETEKVVATGASPCAA